jgi:hypothetical protein
MARDVTEPSTRRVGLEFGVLMAGGLIAFGVQTLFSEEAAAIPGIPLYIGISLFLWRRGRVLAKLNRQINRAIWGGKGGERSEAVSAWIFPAMGLLGLLLIPAALVYWAIDSLT